VITAYDLWAPPGMAVADPVSGCSYATVDDNDTLPYPMRERTVSIAAGYDNAISLVLLHYSDATPLADDASAADWPAVDLSSVTRVVFKLGSVTIDSDVNPTLFDWSGQDAAGNDLLVIKPGTLFSAATEGYATVITYDPNNPNGIVWINSDPDTAPSLFVKVLAV
jgi:hypothetical protein